jgi:hypothetical protein
VINNSLALTWNLIQQKLISLITTKKVKYIQKNSNYLTIFNGSLTPNYYTFVQPLSLQLKLTSGG